ncbi:MAG: phosphotransferase [Eubacteriales bacterium]|nr:phosphotransferase [Eubacteriales bacterium]
MKKCISKNNSKSVYVDGGFAKKVFEPAYSKSDVLYEALNTARVEDAGVSIPKLVSVSVEDGKWTITSEYVEGMTMTELLAAHPENTDEYMESFVDYQIDFNKRTNPLLIKLKDKLNRQINSLTNVNNSTIYELLTRLESMPKHTKLCHGDYCTDNVIVSIDKNNKITKITAVDWVHATQGNASADAANTYLMLKLVNAGLAEKYLDVFCKKTNTKKNYVTGWFPIVAAARLTKKNPAEKELLEQWIDIVDFQ